MEVTIHPDAELRQQLQEQQDTIAALAEQVGRLEQRIAEQEERHQLTDKALAQTNVDLRRQLDGQLMRIQTLERQLEAVNTFIAAHTPPD